MYGESDEATLDGYLDELLFAACASIAGKRSFPAISLMKVSNLAFSVTEEEVPSPEPSLRESTGQHRLRWSEGRGN